MQRFKFSVTSTMKKKDTPCRASEPDKYVYLFASHGLALWEYDCLTGECTFADDYFRLLGLEQAGITFGDTKGFRSFIHPDDLFVFDEAFAQVLAGGASRAFSFRCVSPAGEVVWLEEHFSPYPSGAHVRPEKLLSFTRNITNEQAEKEQNRKINTKYHALLNAMLPNFVFIFNRDFTFYEIILPDGLRLFDDPNDLLGKSARIIYSPEVSELFIKNIRECLGTGELRSIEYHVDLMGKRFYYQAYIVPYEGDKAFALIRDISDRVRRVNDLVAARERAEEADRMKSAFLANMSHEIRTPLNAIVGFSELIAEGEIPEKEKTEFLQIIRTNSDLLLKLIGDILDLARIESGKSVFVYQNVHLVTLLDEVKRVHQLKINPQVEFEVVYPSAGLWLKTDPDRVKQILYNFLSNAIKNTPEGRITLGAEEKGGKLCFFVSDTGRGIPRDKLKVIFERFEKVNSFVQGTGLGLFICTTLAKRLGGNLEVESTLGEGSTFSFNLPYDNPENRFVTASSEELEIPKKVRKNPLILIAENTEAHYAYAQDILRENYEILYATNGQEAVALFSQERPDLVLMSIQLPLMDGLESARRIRSMSSTVPIIGLVSNDFYMEQKEAMENGYNDVIARPYAATKLKEVVLAFL